MKNVTIIGILACLLAITGTESAQGLDL